ncbi:POTRA domain-containing protein, partial [Alphaproteobacteria bacterium]|nr:POTRA domain-containing protein [Alphaproteobacteria bacterium]
MTGFKQLLSKSGILSIILLICLMMGSQAFAQKITDISVSGNQRVSEGTIRSYLPIDIDDDISTSALDSAIDRLFATSLFSDVDISNENGLIKIFVTENPIINRVTVEGNDVLETNILIAQLGIQPRRVYTKKVAIDGMQKLLQIYELSGRYGASVEPVIIKLDNNRVDLVFEVDEGPLIKISSIQF